MVKNFDDLLARIKTISRKKVAIAVAQDKAVLEAAKAAKERDIADAILVGNEKEIRAIGAELGTHHHFTVLLIAFVLLLFILGAGS